MSKTRTHFVGSVLAAVSAVGLSIAVFSPGAVAATATTVSANTHAANHIDTTSVSGSATVPSEYGPIWAYDNFKIAIAATPANATDNYTVVLTVTGSFAGFANPRTQAEMGAAGLTSPAPGDALISSGSVKGTYNLRVQSSTPPKASNLLAQQDPATGLSSMVRQLFGGDASVTVTGENYSFVYNKVEGVTYRQVG